MINKIKMALFKDKNNKLNKKITRPLPEVIESFNTLILSYVDEKDNFHFDMGYITPAQNNIGLPVSFDFLFLTGEYSGLFLENISPLNTTFPGSETPIKDQDTKASIIPAKLIAKPQSYDSNYYYFKIGDYQSSTLDVHAVMNIYDRIRQDDVITLEDAKLLIDKVNSTEFPKEFELSR